MSDVAELYRRAIDLFGAQVHAVKDDQWHLPTPCTDWDVRDLLHHITWSNLWVAPLVDGRSLDEVEGAIAVVAAAAARSTHSPYTAVAVPASPHHPRVVR